MRALLRFVLRRAGLAALRVRVRYKPLSVERLRAGPVLVCANHVSLIDGVIVALASPVPLVFGVDTEFSRRSLLARRGMAALAALGFGRVVPIDAGSPFGLRALRKALDRGEPVMLFPEGRISDTGAPLPPRPGVDWLAARCRAPVLCVRIRGAERSRAFAKAGTAWWPPIEIEF
ncbi:phospholipid/glycerol acyltransferase [Burkholderiales bacterium GJ-E10]|nr:phospholipid/glycerol acyltransferase [Burkholderiales bacterium GJ-E10]